MIDRLSRSRITLAPVMLSLVLALTFQIASDAALAGTGAKPTARTLFRKANIRFNLGEYDAALQLYRDAYTLKPLPGFLFNIAQCHYNLGHYAKALTFYQRYLIQSPHAKNRPAVERLMAAAQTAIRKQAATRKPPATTPTPGPTTAHPKTPPATAPTTPGPTTAHPKTPPATAPISSSLPKDSASRPVTQPSPSDETLGTSSKIPAILLWTGVGVSSILIATSMITGGVALGQSSEFKDPSTALTRQRELLDSGPSLRTTATVTAILGIAAGLGTAAYYWFGYRKAMNLSAAATPLPRGEGVAFAVSGAF